LGGVEGNVAALANGEGKVQAQGLRQAAGELITVGGCGDNDARAARGEGRTDIVGEASDGEGTVSIELDGVAVGMRARRDGGWQAGMSLRGQGYGGIRPRGSVR
jgi:hypothetical protein